jgi:hypothetical protein
MAKQSELQKLLKKIEKKVDKYNNNPYDISCPFYDLDDYVEYIRKELKLTKKSDVYIFDMEVPNYMDNFYTTLMGYVGKDVSIQVNQSYVAICEGEVDLIVLVVTNN